MEGNSLGLVVLLLLLLLLSYQIKTPREALIRFSPTLHPRAARRFQGTESHLRRARASWAPSPDRRAPGWAHYLPLDPGPGRVRGQSKGSLATPGDEDLGAWRRERVGPVRLPKGMRQRGGVRGGMKEAERA